MDIAGKLNLINGLFSVIKMIASPIVSGILKVLCAWLTWLAANRRARWAKWALAAAFALPALIVMAMCVGTMARHFFG